MTHYSETLEKTAIIREKKYLHSHIQMKLYLSSIGTIYLHRNVKISHKNYTNLKKILSINNYQ